MWSVLKALGWIGVGVAAWMLLAVVCLSFMYFRGWLNPKRTEKIREYEDALEADALDAANGEPRAKRPPITSIATPRRAR